MQPTAPTIATPSSSAAVRGAPRPTQAPSAGVRIDPVRVLRQNQWKIAIAAVVGIGVGVVAHVLFDRLAPRYTGTVLFELRAAIQEASQVIAADTRAAEAVERMAQTESARLLSRSLLETAVRGRDIENTQWSRRFRDANGLFLPDEAVDNLEKTLSAGHRRRTQYFALSWSAADPADVPVVLNRIAETYLQVRRANDDKRYATNLNVFQAALNKLDNDLIAIGRDIAKFIRDRNITSLDAAATDITQAMQDVAGRVGEAKTAYSMTVTRAQQTEAKLQGRLEPSSEDIRRAEQDPLLMGANQTLRDLRIAFDIVRQQFQPGHGEYRRAERAMLAAEAESEAMLKSVVQRNLTADFKDFSDQIEGFASLLKKHEDDYEKLQDRLKELAADKSELTQLQDQRDRLQEQRSRLLDLINDLNSLKVREDAQSVTIAQPATTPREKSFPRLQIMVPLGALLGVVSLLAFAFVRELLDQRVRYPSDLVGIPVRLLGIVPDVADDPTGVKRVENAIREAPQSVVAESLRQIAVQVCKQLRAGGHRTVLAVGAMPESGVTSILTNIAESLASSGQRVLLVDANFRRPGLAKALGVDGDRAGLGEILAGRIRFDGAPVEIAERVHFLNVGAPSERVFERLNTGATDAVLAEAKSRYDVVLVDAPPAVVAGDAMILAGKVDATLLVVRAYQEQRGLVGRLVSQLNDMPSTLVGLLLNRPRNTAGGYFRKNFETMARYAEGAAR